MTSLVFITLWILSLVFMFFQNKSIKINDFRISGRLFYLFVISGSLFIVSGFRSANVGNDTWNYAMNVFPYIQSFSSIGDLLLDDVQTGKVYWSIFYFLSSFSKSPQIYILGESFLIVFCMAFYVYKATKNVGIAVFIFLCSFFVTSMTAARQYTGIVLAANALLFLHKDLKSIIGWTLVCMSISIHAVNVTIILAILGILLARSVFSAYRLFFITCGITLFIGIMVDLLLPIVLTFIFTDYIGYFNSDWNQNVLVGQAGYGFGILALHTVFLLFIILYCMRATQKDCESLEYALLPAVSVAAVGGILFHDNMVMPRCFYGLDFLMISFLPACLNKFSGIKYYLLLAILIIGISIGYFRVFLVNDYIYSFY